MHELDSTYKDDILVPGLSGTGFLIGLYLEHLEEVSFLYEQRLDLLDDPEVTWLDIGDFEDRVEAHLDALVLGEDLALAVCKQQACEGDFGELHAAVRVFCRHHRWDLVQEVLDMLDPADDERVQAVCDALCHEAPAEWEPRFVEMLSRGAAMHQRIAARLVGHRRIEAGTHLLPLLEQDEAGLLPGVIWALGRLRYTPVRVRLYEQHLQHEDEAVRAAAALALLRIGEPQTVQFCSVFARSQPWTHVFLGLGGSRSEAPTLLDVASSEAAAAESLLALGLLGDPAAVEALLYRLDEEALAEAAATALHLITGADLYEDAFIPEEIDEDELFEDELEKLRRGESLTPPGEDPPGEIVTRLSQNQDAWQAWWAENKARFQPGIRYRNGMPYSPAGLLETLMADTNLHQIRRWAYEELVIRYGLDVPFETDLFVADQQQALAQIAAWVQTQGTAFREGKWYFAGTLATW